MIRLALALTLLPLTAHAGGAVFFHPDGMGVNTWSAVRAVKVGPDGELHWDTLPHIAIYKGHMNDTLTASSNGGATVHAYGEKTSVQAFGLMDTNKLSIAHQALKAGKGLALVNSGSIIEPGTAAFVARTTNRKAYESIAEQVIHSGAHIILSGGEQWLLPHGAKGTHGEGKRSDGKNLIDEAKANGYTIVYNAQELAAIDPNTTPKLLGVFAHHHTFYDAPMKTLQRKGLPLFNTSAPTIAEMTSKALAILRAHHADNFLLITEEEGTDNFGNKGNIHGVLEAGKRADDALGTIQRFIGNNPNTSLFTTSDSDAGGLQLIDCGKTISDIFKLSACSAGTSFTSKPDRNGTIHHFNTHMSSKRDVMGGIVIRGSGKYGHLVQGTMDNTAVYELLRQALFEE